MSTPRRGTQPAFWLAVGGVSLLSHVVFNLAADRLPWTGLSRLETYMNRSNG